MTTKKAARPEAEFKVYCTKAQKRELAKRAKSQKPIKMSLSAYVLTAALERSREN